MEFERAPLPAAQISDPGTLLRAVAVCDLTNSTGLVERLGDQQAAELIRQHDRMTRITMQRHDGREIDKSDGFLVLFDRPIQAVAFALDYQRGLRAMAAETGHALSARVGIHVGDVVVWRNAPQDVDRGAKPMEVEGLAKPLAARLMALAAPGQILMSGLARTLAQRAQRELGSNSDQVRWIGHGQYLLKGIPEPIPVYEVGIVGLAPLRAPPGSSNARRRRVWWRHTWALVSAAILLLAAALIMYSTLRSESALAFSERDWIVLGDVINVNADATLVAPLATAFRIGLEQSRFVNVLPDAQVREALARMQRDSGTRLDRGVGSEVALRQHARALILPSVAQYGRWIRISAEIVDPHAGRTVSTQTADASDPNELLSAMDALLRRTRGSLGESLAQIHATAEPLEKVTTANMDALRALSRALQAWQEGDFEQAGNLLKHATELDPSFATAYARLGSVLFSQERYPEARVALYKAASMEGRLTGPERLLVRGLLARFTDARSMFEVWQTYAQLYPDRGTGQHNMGNACYMFLLDYPCAEAAFVAATKTRKPLLNYTRHTLGRVLLAEDKIEEAVHQFRTALDLVPTGAMFGLSDALVASGQFDAASRYLEQPRQLGRFAQVDRDMRRVTLLIARGDLEEAMATLSTLLPEAARLHSPNPRWRAEAAVITLEHARGRRDAARGLAARHLAELASMATRPDANLETTEELLYAAAWAARLGLTKEAREALVLARDRGGLDRFPVRARLAALVEGEIDLEAGKPNVVMARVASAIDLWELHELRARCLRALGDTHGEIAELRWLAKHRGLAYGQWTDEMLGQQARALALREAEQRLPQLERR